jgi:formylglycine-generating enzyme required for sulfatase activity
MLYTDNNGRTSALPFIFTGMILLLICAANSAVLHCEGEEIAKKEATSKAGDLLELTIKKVKFRFHWCLAGTFKMGSPTSENDRNNDEKQHQVTLSKGFWMGETEVTQEQWKSIMGDNPSNFKGEKLPVEKISWDACQEFVKKLNALGIVPKGYKFSLPTEAQWEYACRAGSTTAYCFGDSADSLDAHCWYGKNSDGRTHEVGTKKANAWGLYDMHGNVWEWCNDWYGDYPSPTASASELTDPIGASSGGYRVVRGGSLDDNAGPCRSANRDFNTPDYTRYYFGVRVSLVSGQ